MRGIGCRHPSKTEGEFGGEAPLAITKDRLRKLRGGTLGPTGENGGLGLVFALSLMGGRAIRGAMAVVGRSSPFLRPGPWGAWATSNRRQRRDSGGRFRRQERQEEESEVTSIVAVGHEGRGDFFSPYKIIDSENFIKVSQNPNKVARDPQGLPTVPHNEFGGLNVKGLVSKYLFVMITSP